MSSRHPSWSSSAIGSSIDALTGTRLPALELPVGDNAVHPVVAPDAAATVLFTYPGADLDLDDASIPGAAGCTLENRLFRDAWPEFRRADVAVHGISTQLPYEQAFFARTEAIPYPLLSDTQHRLTAALRLRTFRGAGRLRLKRLILVVDRERTVRHALFPVEDIPHAVEEALRLAATT
ncbi:MULTISPECIES: redoxin domain-containing protein [unclassified Streptomyces]|uniref:redoxin domain-containing protein n=1 Tax=unclassified Streptomyces TaxID=2593676 RepID=UPI003803C6EA